MSDKNYNEVRFSGNDFIFILCFKICTVSNDNTGYFPIKFWTNS